MPKSSSHARPLSRPDLFRKVNVLIVFAISLMFLLPLPASASVSLLEMVRTALDHSPGILLERQNMRSSESSVLATRSPFDPQISLSSGYSHVDSTALVPELKTVSSTLSSSTLLPFGLIIAPSVSVKGSTQPGLQTSNVATAGVSFTLPLMQGLGNNSYRMALRASRKSYEAEGYMLQHTATKSIYSAAGAYWNYVYAYRTLKLDHQLTHNAEESLRATKALAGAGEVAVVRASQAEAYLQQLEATELSDAQALRQAWSDLFIAIGRPTKGREEPEEPIDAFPIPDGDVARLGELSKLRTKALSGRADLHALKLQSDATNDLLTGSRNQMKPKIDLILFSGYNGEHKGSTVNDYITSLTSQVPGPNVSATLSYTFAAGNHSNESAFIRSSAVYETAVINREALERTIVEGVGVAAESVKNTAAVWRLSMKSAETYRILNAVELKKFRGGISDLFKVQNVSTDLANAEKQLLGAERAYASALLTFRYQIAALMHEHDGLYSVDEHDLVTIPVLENAKNTL